MFLLTLPQEKVKIKEEIDAIRRKADSESDEKKKLEERLQVY